jgi:hypothetical protein
MGVGNSNSVSYPRIFHLGFIQSSEAQVEKRHG